MSITSKWIVPGRMISIHLAGHITKPEYDTFQKHLQSELKQVSVRLDYLLDLSTLEDSDAESLLHLLLNRRAALRSIKTGRLFVIGASEQSHLVMDSLARALHLKAHYVEKADDALSAAVELDLDD